MLAPLAPVDTVITSVARRSCNHAWGSGGAIADRAWGLVVQNVMTLRTDQSSPLARQRRE